MSEAVIINHLSKWFGSPNVVAWKRLPHLAENKLSTENTSWQDVVALENVSFVIHPGEIFGVVGPGGSGKSTLIRLLATLLPPDCGELRIFGYDVIRQPAQVQRLINRVSVEASFFKKLSPFENLVRSVHLSGVSEMELRQRVVDLLAQLGLDAWTIYQPMESMSRCTQQKVFIARALLVRPRLLLLDDPANGLDTYSRTALQEVLRELRDVYGVTILFTTRLFSEAQAFCDRIALLDHGRITALDAPAGLAPSFEPVQSEVALPEVFPGLIASKLIQEDAAVAQP